MACEHKRLACSNAVFYCLDCGAKVDPPTVKEAAEEVKEAATERPKRRTKKGATKA